MIRPPPRSTLFPTRRSSDLGSAASAGGPWMDSAGPEVRAVMVLVRMRSEEHTSELQSRFDLVCRLLLEKKKKKNTPAARTRKYPPTRNGRDAVNDDVTSARN